MSLLGVGDTASDGADIEGLAGADLVICIEGAGVAGIEGTGSEGWKGTIFLKNFLFLFVTVLFPSILTV